ncbi:ABC transporter ATP-binding protein [Vescimonas sp.]|jgi:peptide/nickel transport system ATP-binding protein|uniref:ABC transporter ATP-binding protein n=1 Tax=Vescimonas sp. TaxID=2892404 RepID=UPI003F7EE932
MTEQNNTAPLLSVRDLQVVYHTKKHDVHAVNGISFDIQRKKTLGFVGETGAGKTTTALSLLRLLPERTAKVLHGSILFEGKDLMQLSERDMQKIRGEKIAMIFQDPMTALNPTVTVGEQIAEALLLHSQKGTSMEKIHQRVDEVLMLVGIPPERKKEYPHQFSGGMKQRVVIAIALACEPELLIADEPTTALDVTIQAQILSLMNDIRERLGTSMLMITHDLGIIAETCDDVAVMYAGQIVEYGTVEDIFSPGRHHPYTTGLFEAIPNLTAKARRLKPIDGMMPDPADLPAGCKFAERCSHCTDRCRAEEPGIFTENGHRIKCFLFQGKVQQSVLAPDGK